MACMLDARGGLPARSRLAVVIACVIVLAWSTAAAAPPAGAAEGVPIGVAEGSGGAATSDLPPWTGGVSLYRSGSFTTQQTWMWCTAAGIQISRNMVYGERDHSASAQRRYFEWMRPRNRYPIPAKDGVDPAAWAAGMRHFVDDRYRLASQETFDQALRLAVTRIRLTSLPVAIAVMHGNHAWLLTGFTATADPAGTTDFTVTSVRVVGPLYGLQSRNGYDMKPNTKLTVRQLRGFFTPFHYAPIRMAWEGRFVSIQPVPRPVHAPAVAPSAAPTPAPTWPAEWPSVAALVGLGVASLAWSAGPSTAAVYRVAGGPPPAYPGMGGVVLGRG
jgi:hypothetical protein